MENHFPALPSAFRLRIASQLGNEESNALCAALDDTAATTVSLRINPLKPVAPHDAWTRVPWCDRGFVLPERPDFTADPLLHAGCYYVQEAASMAISLAYEAMEEKPSLLLDLCAAPGGKSTLWRSLMPQGCFLVANEPVHQRAMILRENLQKWGQPDMLVTESLSEAFGRLGGLFDVIAADVPCSGEGMFRKDPNARSEWSEANAEMCAGRQREIVRDAWPALREGGYMVYSTCTFNPAENEENVRWICRELGAEIVPLHPNPEWGICEEDGFLRFFPHRTRGEGFFLALLQKHASQAVFRLRKIEKTVSLPRGWLADERAFAGIVHKDGSVSALRQTLLPAATAIRAAVRTIATGVEMAHPKGKKLQPAHALALSTSLATDAFPRVELSLNDALQYLSRQSLCLSSETPRGYVLATYQDRPLGFLNNLGTRANNLYPNEWRIRRSILG